MTQPHPLTLAFHEVGDGHMEKLPTAPEQRVYMLVVTDYLTKWIEANAFHLVQNCEVNNFVWKNIICHFGVPKEIVTENGS